MMMTEATRAKAFSGWRPERFSKASKLEGSQIFYY
jgi:hypothetical protein